MSIEEQQEQFIWLAHGQNGENKKFADIAEELKVSVKQITEWESTTKERWQELAAIRKIYITKKIGGELKEFYHWYKKKEKNKKCFYCDITENEIEQLCVNSNKKDGKSLTKRLRGKKLELDRLKPNNAYSDLLNIEFACYWCNNAKTDTFTHEEFIEVGKVLKEIWKKRLSE